MVDGPGHGSPVLLAHGITAHRELVVHGSKALQRGGRRVARYDARAHGESGPGAPGSFGYEQLGDDLEVVAGEAFGSGAVPVLVGHSMGAHTVVAAALRDPGRYAGIVVIGPVSTGAATSERELERWDRLAAGLESGGVDGFISAYDSGLDPDWRETLLRIARERLSRHRDPAALAVALREVPRSRPFDSLDALAALELPALVVASHDAADPGHPYATAVAYAEAIGGAELVSEESEADSPLAWQGGKLSRVIDGFCSRDDVAARLGG